MKKYKVKESLSRKKYIHSLAVLKSILKRHRLCLMKLGARRWINCTLQRWKKIKKKKKKKKKKDKEISKRK